jgi:hypothetical protein
MNVILAVQMYIDRMLEFVEGMKALVMDRDTVHFSTYLLGFSPLTKKKKIVRFINLGMNLNFSDRNREHGLFAVANATEGTSCIFFSLLSLP